MTPRTYCLPISGDCTTGARAGVSNGLENPCTARRRCLARAAGVFYHPGKQLGALVCSRFTKDVFSVIARRRAGDYKPLGHIAIRRAR